MGTLGLPGAYLSPFEFEVSEVSDKSTIEWTDATWNPIRGCTRVSEGCRNCYAEHIAARFSEPGQPYEGIAQWTKSREPRWTGKIVPVPEHLKDPIGWKRPRMIFVNSMSDLFHENLSFEFVIQICHVMRLAPQHTYQILTKRPERMRYFFERAWQEMPPANWWLGTSVEDQPTADRRIPELLKTRATVRWISAEPLLGPIPLWEFGPIPALDWVVVGGESGPNARPMNPEWPQLIRDQCVSAGVPFFFKQWGEWIPTIVPGAGLTPVRVGKHKAGRLLDGCEWNEYPRGVGIGEANRSSKADLAAPVR